MRKLLLATTALVGVVLAGSAQAAAPSSPITLNVGGYVDTIMGFFHESQATAPSNEKRTGHDLEAEYKLNFDATGKAANGVEYGATASIWNGPEADNLWESGGNGTELAAAYVHLSGAFGKFLAGQEHGASDLFVYAPTIGEGQIDGRYQDFVDTRSLAHFQGAGFDNTEHSTKVTYYTPKVGNDMNKVQAGISYAPTLYDYGQFTSKYNTTGVVGGTNVSAYRDIVKGAVEYTGNFRPVTVAASVQVITGTHSKGNLNNTILGGSFSGTATGFGVNTQTPAGFAKDFNAFGFGTQVGYAGFTFGGSYTDLGRYNTTEAQRKRQDVITLGGKYEFDKVGVALNYLSGRGYQNYLGHNTAEAVGTPASNINYVSDYNAYGAGATYTWFPGMTSNADAVLFDQKVRDQANKNDGYVFLISQKMAF